MKKALLLFISFAFHTLSFSQDLNQFFDDTSASSYLNTIKISFDTSANNIWQIGAPQKSIFDSASTLPNAIVTDTLNTYPANNESVFSYTYSQQQYFYGIHAIQWKQKLDMDMGGDGGIIEFSVDGGLNWQNGFNNPLVYNFYGFDSLNVDTLPTGEKAFTGTDTVWRDIWFCFDYSYLSQYDSLMVRHRFVSDSVDNGREGWMIDNLIMHVTLRHTIAEKNQEQYLKVYPTNTTGIVNIEAKKMNEFHIIEQLVVYDLNGKLVQHHKNVPTKYFVDLSKEQNGNYFIYVKTNKMEERFQVVLQR